MVDHQFNQEINEAPGTASHFGRIPIETILGLTKVRRLIVRTLPWVFLITLHTLTALGFGVLIIAFVWLRISKYRHTRADSFLGLRVSSVYSIV